MVVTILSLFSRTQPESKPMGYGLIWVQRTARVEEGGKANESCNRHLFSHLLGIKPYSGAENTVAS
jgi:hypothetical protein